MGTDKPINVETGVWERVLRGLEKEGEVTADADFDEGVDEEIEWEREQLENGVGDVEYVSDIEGESEDDMGDFEDWVGGQSQEEDDDDDNDNDDESEEGEDESEEDDVDALKKTLANLKRKRPTGPPPKAKKKPTKKDSKGPRREIEYEIEREPPVREVLRV